MRLWGFLLLDAWDSFKICRCLPSFYTVKTNAKICWLLFKAHAWPCGWLLNQNNNKQRFEAERNTIPLCPKLSFLSRCSGCLQCRSRYSLSCPLLTSDRFGTWSKPAPSVGDKEVIGRLNPSRLCVSQTWCHDLDVYHYSKIFQFWFGINVWMILSHVSCETLAFLSFFTAWDVGSKSLSERFWAHFKRLPAWRAAQSVQDLYTVAVGPFLQWGTDEFGAPTTACWGGRTLQETACTDWQTNETTEEWNFMLCLYCRVSVAVSVEEKEWLGWRQYAAVSTSPMSQSSPKVQLENNMVIELDQCPPTHPLFYFRCLYII